MPQSSFHPASLELLPGELARPPLRLLEAGVRRSSRAERGQTGRAALSGEWRTPVPDHWLDRLYQAVRRTGLV